MAMEHPDEAGRRVQLVSSIVVKARTTPDPKGYIRTLTLGALRAVSDDDQLAVAEKPRARREVHALMKLAMNELLSVELVSQTETSAASTPEEHPT